jgi:hypothetical protein
MTVLDREAVVAPRAGWWIAVALPVGPLAVALLRYLLPYRTTDDAAAMVSAVAAHPGRQSAVLWLGLLAVLTLVPGVLVAVRLAGDSRLSRTAIVLLVPAYLCLGGLLSEDLLLWSGVHAHVDMTTLVAILSAAHPTVGIASAIFVVGHVVGTVLLGVALLRSGRIPPWAGWAITVSQPLHFVAAVVVGSHTLDLVAWSLTAVGMATCAAALRQPLQQSTSGRPLSTPR